MVADMQRARMLAWDLPKYGWNVEILAPDKSYQDPLYLDQDSEAFFCPDTPVHYTQPLHPLPRHLIRSSTIGWKALLPLHATARTLFARHRYDLVYISTAKFNLFLLGWWWRKRYGLPYILDIHDPVYRKSPVFFGGTKPGLKRTLSLLSLKHIEERTIPTASALVSVSSKYTEVMMNRYKNHSPDWLLYGHHKVIPFPACDRDLLKAMAGVNKIEQHGNEVRRIIYVGAGGPVMLKAFSALCNAIRLLIARQAMPDVLIRFELYGTMLGWKEGDRKQLYEIAQDAGIGELVCEEPQHVTYRRSLELLLGADGVLVLGVDDEGYMPSKLYTYALSGKPLLGVFRRPSDVHDMFVNNPCLGHMLPYDDNNNNGVEVIAPIKRFIEEVAVRVSLDRWETIRHHSSQEMARRHSALFDAVIGSHISTKGAS